MVGVARVESSTRLGVSLASRADQRLAVGFGGCGHARRVVWQQDGQQKVGLPVIRLHDVRHSYATAALAAGIPAKIVSERLGHANVQITLDTYSHVIPGLDEQAAATVARLILEGPDTASTGSPGSDAANSAAKRGRPPLQRGGEGRRPW